MVWILYLLAPGKFKIHNMAHACTVTVWNILSALFNKKNSNTCLDKNVSYFRYDYKIVVLKVFFTLFRFIFTLFL